MFTSAISQIGALIMAVVCLFTAWAGGRPQKVIAAIVVVAWVVTSAIQDRSFQHPQYLTLVFDSALTVLFVALALRWRGAWLTGVAAFQVLTTATHLAMILDPRIWPKASITAYMVWSYLVLACVAWGGVEGLLARRRLATGQ